GMLFDSCASGGRRNDLETLRFSFMHTFTDYWQYTLPSQCQKFGCNMWYIFSGGVLYNAFTKYEIRSRLSLSVGLDINPVNDKTLEVLDEWRYDHKYLTKDYYVLTDYDLTGENNMAVEFNDPDKGCGMLIGYLRHGGSFVFKCRGLEPDKRYLITDRDDPDLRLVMTGGDMMSRGVPVSRPRSQEAPCLEYSLTDLPLSDVPEYTVSEFDTAPFEGENDMAMLVREYKNAPPAPGCLEFVSPDFDNSGAVYGISEDLYELLPFNGPGAKDGWIKLDPARLFLEINAVLPLTTWPEGGFFDVAAYARKYDGCCFLWLDNSYTFGDIDGGAKTQERRFGIMRDGDIVWSKPFVLHVSEWDKPQAAERAVYYVCYDSDGTGTVYRADKMVWDELPAVSAKTESMGVAWYLLDREKISLSADGDTDNITAFKGEKNGKYYLWLRNSRSLEVACTAKLYYLKDKIKKRTVFWLVGNRFRSQLEPLPAVEEF
ncbi:MAG: hypothetical protein IJT95_00605, partial [Abditibacteriota bacterium]|nr:hypothetical protein [Abditibacteriota bacterium]